MRRSTARILAEHTRETSRLTRADYDAERDDEQRRMSLAATAGLVLLIVVFAATTVVAYHLGSLS